MSRNREVVPLISEGLAFGRLSPQDQSTLYHFPQEIRDEIYSQLFQSMSLLWKDHFADHQRLASVESVPNALALLRTCRRIHVEIGKRWLGMVLAHIPRVTLTKIRQLHVIGDHGLLTPQRLCVSRGDNGEQQQPCVYSVSAALSMLPGLCVDRLTVIAGNRINKKFDHGSLPELRYWAVDQFANSGYGWKELHYYSPDPKMLGYRITNNTYAPVYRAAQPRDWAMAMCTREHQELAPTNPAPADKPSVKIFFCDEGGEPPYEYGQFAKKKWWDRTAPGTALMADKYSEKQILIVIKRGANADYEVKRRLWSHWGIQPRKEGVNGLTQAYDDPRRFPRNHRAEMAAWNGNDEMEDPKEDAAYMAKFYRQFT
ncbi:hypothetical protein B0H63DRAFT_539054 [Podospora didyma]|uniref:F-box domain-containing protein n=1 Tax=Podospora didyma TaxID=330526 RepID=A0AAE0NZU1_9PEZI|nr:hypothetical protein B0H63DRAFT_539054 [Podospora didyma]